MKTKYYIWKQPSCNGINPDWTEINGQEFYALVNSPEGKGRHFVKLDSTDNDDGRIVMEATKAEYDEWRKEKRHKQYLRDSAPGYTQFSYHAMETEDGCYGEELLRDANCDVETECFKVFENAAVRTAIAQLGTEEQRMIEYLYLSDKQGTERGYSELTGIPQKTINDRKNRTLSKMQKFLKK